MTTAMDEPDVYGTGGAAPPSFSAKMSDYSQWGVDAKIWHNGARMKDEQKESRLYSGQSNKHVKNVMLKIGLENIFKCEGFDKILSAMDKKLRSSNRRKRRKQRKRSMVSMTSTGRRAKTWRTTSPK